MALQATICALSVFWAIVHIVKYFKLASRPFQRSILPLNRPLSSLRWTTDSRRTVEAEVKGLHIRVQITSLNTVHKSFVAYLSKNRAVHNGLVWFYNLGVAASVLGMLVACGILARTWGQVAWGCYVRYIRHTVAAPPVSFVPNLAKRDGDGLRIAENTPTFSITPIIPGVTVPLSHLVLIIGAVFVAQIIHELGHAIAAALDSLPLTAAGASFTVILPAAFVTFPATLLDSVSSVARARVITAGPFHNLVFWFFLTAVSLSGLGKASWRAVGYRDMSSLGRVVIDIGKDSPLFDFIPPGSLITDLDDTLLGFSPDRDSWTSYLLNPLSHREKGEGWCVEQALLRPDTLCCHQEAKNSTSGLFCFEAINFSMEQACIDPYPILTSNQSARCSSKSACPDSQVCVRQSESERLLRLTIEKVPLSGHKEIILWSGPIEEVWEEVEVGNLLPSYKVLPLWLPSVLETFRRYLFMATLSLFFFNLLPLPHLDGAQFLNTILDYAFQDRPDLLAQEYDVEALEAPRQSERRPGTKLKHKLSRSIPLITTWALLSSIVFAAMLRPW